MRVLSVSAVLVGVTLPDLAAAQIGRPGAGLRDRRGVVRLANQLNRQSDQLLRLVVREATSYRPEDRRAVQVTRQLSDRASVLARVANISDGTDIRRLRVLNLELDDLIATAGRIYLRANFSMMVERELRDVRILNRQLRNLL